VSNFVKKWRKRIRLLELSVYQKLQILTIFENLSPHFYTSNDEIWRKEPDLEHSFIHSFIQSFIHSNLQCALCRECRIRGAGGSRHTAGGQWTSDIFVRAKFRKNRSKDSALKGKLYQKFQILTILGIIS